MPGLVLLLTNNGHAFAISQKESSPGEAVQFRYFPRDVCFGGSREQCPSVGSPTTASLPCFEVNSASLQAAEARSKLVTQGFPRVSFPCYRPKMHLPRRNLRQ